VHMQILPPQNIVKTPIMLKNLRVEREKVNDAYKVK